jgi:hypothetical protein
MITTINEFRKINEFHGSNARPEMIDLEGGAKLANYTGAPVRNVDGKWKVFPKVDQIVYFSKDSHGFSTSNLEGAKVFALNPGQKFISLDVDGVELGVVFRISDAGNKENDKIAYFASAE